MIIEKDWFFQLRDKDTKEITCKVLFRTVDNSRKVDINTTGLLICEIKRWIKIYEEIMIPNFNKNDNKYREIIDSVSYWKVYKDYLIPENRTPFKDDFTKQHFVKLNYKLLEPNKLLTYNQALFLLLGLDSTELDHSMRDFPVLDGARPIDVFEFIFWNTEQNQILKTSSYLQNNKITSEDLIKLADENNFFTKHNDFLAKRTIDEVIMKKLHELLIDSGFITGEFDDFWQWNANRNQLSYLAKKLKQVRIFNDNCHQQIISYIQDPSKAKRPLKNIKDPTNTKTIDGIIAQLTP